MKSGSPTAFQGSTLSYISIGMDASVCTELLAPYTCSVWRARHIEHAPCAPRRDGNGPRPKSTIKLVTESRISYCLKIRKKQLQSMNRAVLLDPINISRFWREGYENSNYFILIRYESYQSNTLPAKSRYDYEGADFVVDAAAMLPSPSPTTSQTPSPQTRRRRSRTRDDPRGLRDSEDNGADWRARIVSRCLSSGAAARAELRDDARRRRRAVISEMQMESLVGEEGIGREVSVGEADCWEDVGDAEIDQLVSELEQELERESRAMEEEALVRAAEEMSVSCGDEAVADAEAEAEADSGVWRMGGGEIVVCPVCGRGKLGIMHGFLFCKCGVRVNGGAEDSITLEMVRERLASVYSEHAKGGCQGVLVFEARDSHNLGFTFLHVDCRKCRMSSIAF